LDLSAGKPIEFDIVYVCDGTGGMGNVTVPTTLNSAVRINVNVLSALQASYIGQTLNFGNVDSKTTAQVLAAPLDFATSPTLNNIRVASSGPYKVEVQSTNNYKLKIANGTDTLNYQAYFLGQTLKPSAPTFAPVTCQRASISGVNLPVRARLVEGGVFKTPGIYSDTITVTISPLLDGAVNQQACSTLTLPAL
jgi:spore coat protein U-like protein